MGISIRQKVKDSGDWWIFICYKGKRKSVKAGIYKWEAERFAKALRRRAPFLNKKHPSRYKHTIAYKLNRSMRTSMGQSLRGAKAGCHWEKLVDYTLGDLKKHLKKQFKPGMCWTNYGEWEIDHVRPVSSFRFTKPEDKAFQECWALSNLQPLWAPENAKKGNKVIAPKRTPTAPTDQKSDLTACNY